MDRNTTQQIGKKVLICLGDRKRELSFNGNNWELNRQAKLLFSDVLSSQEHEMILQLKSEDWDGQFLDINEQTIIHDKSVLRAVEVKSSNPGPSHNTEEQVCYLLTM